MKNYLEIVNGLVNFAHINMANRKIVWYKEYFTDFLSTLDDGTKRKVLQTLRLIQSIDVIPSQYFKHIENAKGLYEIRVEYSGNIYRIFCCFDKGQIVILFNGFKKKSQKTPQQEIEKAKVLMKEYFDLKD